MKEYKVRYTWVAGTSEVYTFVCMAEDCLHAIEQCENAYPECGIVSVAPTDLG